MWHVANLLATCSTYHLALDMYKGEIMSMKLLGSFSKDIIKLTCFNLFYLLLLTYIGKYRGKYVCPWQYVMFEGVTVGMNLTP